MLHTLRLDLSYNRARGLIHAPLKDAFLENLDKARPALGALASLLVRGISLVYMKAPKTVPDRVQMG